VITGHQHVGAIIPLGSVIFASDLRPSKVKPRQILSECTANMATDHLLGF